MSSSMQQTLQHVEILKVLVLRINEINNKQIKLCIYI